MTAIVSYDRWYWRSTSNSVGCCRLETWRDAEGAYHVLITERSDNPGPSIVNDHAKLRSVVENWLEIPKDLSYSWWEQFTEDSYRPRRDGLWSMAEVHRDGGRRSVSAEEWDEVYHAPRRPVPIVKVRKAKQ